jgi:hypothetical protein
LRLSSTTTTVVPTGFLQSASPSLSTLHPRPRPAVSIQPTPHRAPFRRP